jgi:hypothetical protein
MTFGLATTDTATFIDALFAPQHDAHCVDWRWLRFCQQTYGFTPDFTPKVAAAPIRRHNDDLDRSIDAFRAVGGKFAWEH